VLSLVKHESADDALGVMGEIAMKRAALFGRAPVMTDIDVAASLLGYSGEVDPGFVEWRTHAVQGAHHDYERRRSIVDAVPDGVLRMPPQVAPLLIEFRSQLQQSADRDADSGVHALEQHELRHVPPLRRERITRRRGGASFRISLEELRRLPGCGTRSGAGATAPTRSRSRCWWKRWPACAGRRRCS
jgi:hypothetical protein